jgi:hypothetical protein
MRWTLWLAALYNIIFGAWVVLLPMQYFQWLGMPLPNYPEIWQCVGMIVGVYGLGYFIAGFSPILHWPIVLVGFLGKIFGPLGFLKALITGSLPVSFGWILLSNDLVWWIPFALILREAYRHYAGEEPSELAALSSEPLESVLSHWKTQTGQTLWELSHHDPILLIALRHFGCTFCREMVRDYYQRARQFCPSVTPVFLVTGTEAEAQDFFARYGEADALRIHDPHRRLYRSLGLRRGRLGQVFGLKVWLRGLQAGILRGLGVGILQGDGFQMPGAFLIHQGAIRQRFLARSASDSLPLEALCPAEKLFS